VFFAMAAVDLNDPIDWDEVDDFDGEARELACDFFYQVDSDEGCFFWSIPFNVSWGFFLCR
jgi:hypothetical protein